MPYSVTQKQLREVPPNLPPYIAAMVQIWFDMLSKDIPMAPSFVRNAGPIDLARYLLENDKYKRFIHPYLGREVSIIDRQYGISESQGTQKHLVKRFVQVGLGVDGRDIDWVVDLLALPAEILLVDVCPFSLEATEPLLNLLLKEAGITTVTADSILRFGELLHLFGTESGSYLNQSLTGVYVGLVLHHFSWDLVVQALWGIVSKLDALGRFFLAIPYHDDNPSYQYGTSYPIFRDAVKAVIRDAALHYHNAEWGELNTETTVYYEKQIIRVSTFGDVALQALYSEH